MVDAFDWSRTGAYAKVVEIISLLTNPITYTSFYKNILVASGWPLFREPGLVKVRESWLKHPVANKKKKDTSFYVLTFCA